MGRKSELNEFPFQRIDEDSLVCQLSQWIQLYSRRGIERDLVMYRMNKILIYLSGNQVDNAIEECDKK